MEIDQTGKKAEIGERVGLAGAKGRDEAWLRDILFDHPAIIPEEIDSTFAPLVPLCKELRTDAGTSRRGFHQ
jgi:hypothetical protein